LNPKTASVDLQPKQLAVPTGRISRAYFSASIDEFLEFPPTQIIGRLTDASEFSVDLAQRDAWNDPKSGSCPPLIGR
jgi:hypothetical protein